jgi:energy-coupling factor transport system substrate-specific component
MEKKTVLGKLVKTIVGIIIGAGLMFVLQRFASIDIDEYVPNTYINIGIAILAAFSAFLGPVAGFLIGFIGHALTDFLWGGWGGIWWRWVISSGVFGCIIGFFWKSYKIEEGGFGFKAFLTFNGIQIVANALVWVFVARTLDMIMYNEAFEKVSLQSFAAAGLNSATVLVLGSIIILLYTIIANKISDS